jgi:hypothetical protein
MIWLRRINRDIALVAGALVLLGGAYLLSDYPFKFSETILSDLGPFDQKQLDVQMESIKLLITLASLAIGGAGALVLRDDIRTYAGSAPRLSCTILLAALSILFGYVAENRLVWMLQESFFNLKNPVVSWPSRLQFWTFFGAIVGLSGLIIHLWEREDA